MEWVDVLGITAGICTTISTLPQIRKAWKTKKVADVSPWMFAVLMLGVFLWTMYGVVRNDFPLIATNGASLALNSLMLYLMIRYRKKAVLKAGKE